MLGSMLFLYFLILIAKRIIDFVMAKILPCNGICNIGFRCYTHDSMCNGTDMDVQLAS